MLNFNTDNTSYPNPFPPLSDMLSFRVAERDLGWHNKNTDEHVFIPKQKAIVREMAGGGKWLANVGIDYQLVLNTDLFPYIEQHIIETMSPSLLTRVTVYEHSSYNGRDCYREYIFHDMTCHAHKNVAFRMIVGNSYGAKSVSLMSGAIDFFCTNGMITGAHEKQARRHTSGLKLSGLATWISNSMDLFVAYGKRIGEYDDTPIDLTKEDALFEHLVQKKLLSHSRARQAQQAMHQERNARAGRDNRPTLWHLYSALTDWATHSEVRDTGNDHEANTRIQRQLHAERVIKEASQWVTA